MTCKSDATPPLPPGHPTPLCTCSCYRTLGIDFIHGRYIQLDTTAHSKGASPSLNSAFAMFKSLKDYQATTVYKNKVFFSFSTALRGVRSCLSDFSGSSHGQEEAEERQGPHAHSPHSLPTRGCFPFLSVPGTHWSHHTQKQEGFVSPSEVQDSIKHQASSFYLNHKKCCTFWPVWHGPC